MFVHVYRWLSGPKCKYRVMVILLVHITDPKGMKKDAQSVPSKKHIDCLCDHDKSTCKNAKSYELPTCNSRASTKVNNREEFIKLQERVKQHQRKLSENDELLHTGFNEADGCS
ncbi:hypothetical protein MKW94_003251 [Papaver nudicaule]|uniref:Uncharacterized protein n=1 Tax=Papaver nudicaule TaxID=74823 RepID=A0AA41SD15_PAPNU|nr:hypothetical protein [Papaver nudicaule]